jgi:hypothetical protein
MNDKLIVPLDTTENELASRRTTEEIERDRTLLARMYVRGKSQHEMRLSLNSMYPDRPLSGSTINQDLQAIRNAWLNSTLVDFNEAKSKELARLDELEREAFDAWERSKEKHIRLEYEISDDQIPFSVDKIAEVTRKKKRKVIEATVGDIRYLEMIERVADMRCKIFGLYEAKKIQVDWKADALQSGLTGEDIESLKEKTINTFLEVLKQAGEKSGAIKEEDIIDLVMEDK